MPTVELRARPPSPPRSPNLRPELPDVRRRRVRRGRRRAAEDDQPGHRGGARRGVHGRHRPMWTARSRPRGGPTSKVWGRMPGAERAKYMFRIARMVAERARELAVLESLDNGKPIRESRDVDVPTAAAHFFYHAGWADKLELRRARPGPATARRGRRGDPVELPAADGRLEDRAGAGLRQHRRAQAGRDHPADRAGAGRDRRRPSCRRACSTCCPAPATSAPRWSGTPAWTRSRSPAPPRSASRSSARWPAPAAGSPWSWAARRPTSCSTTRRWTRPSRASSTGSSSTRATCAAPARGCWCRSRSPRSSLEKLRRRVSTLRVGDPLDKNTDVGAINSRAAAGPDHRARRGRRGRGRAALDQPVPAARPRVLLPADGVLRRRAGHADRPRGDLRPGAVGAHLPHAGRGGGKANNTPYGLSAGIWTEKGSEGAVDGAADAGRRGVGEHVQPVRPDRARSAGTGSRASAARAAGPGWRPTSMSDASRHRWPRPSTAASVSPRPTSSTSAARSRARSPGAATRSPTPRAAARPRRAGLPQGRPRRGERRPRGLPRLVGRHRLQPRARCSTGSPRCCRAAGEQFVDDVVAAEGVRGQAGRGAGGRGRSTAGSGTRAGPTRSPRCSAR